MSKADRICLLKMHFVTRRSAHIKYCEFCPGCSGRPGCSGLLHLFQALRRIVLDCTFTLPNLTFHGIAQTDTITAFDQVEDLEGSLTCIEKKATIFRHRQEGALAEELDKMYDAVVDAAVNRANEVMGVESVKI